jgi:hypothetical protein
MVQKNKDGGTQGEACIHARAVAYVIAVAYVTAIAGPQLTPRDVEALETRPLL